MANTKTQKARRLLQKGLSVNEVIKRGDVSRSIVYKVKNDMIARGDNRCACDMCYQHYVYKW